MLYFTPRSDLKTVDHLFSLEQQCLEAYIDVVRFADSNPLVRLAPDRLPPDVRATHIENLKLYSSLRASISEYVYPFGKLADRYNAVDPTDYFLEATKLPHYGDVRSTTFTEEDRVYWLDKIHALRGAVKHKKAEDFGHLINPFYWVYAFFHSILHFAGIGKVLGEQVSKVISTLLTAATAIASPWLKQLVVAWFKHFSAK
jgi:hypothetical protein